MRYLVVYRGQLELARAEIRRPLVTIGRSPSCDVVFRAPGARPVHFLAEWIGSGKFDPASGQWAIVDISSSSMGDTGEGVILTSEPVDFGGFRFGIIESHFESKEVIGGRIRESLAQNAGAAGSAALEVLELVQVRADSGSIEEVIHETRALKKKVRPLEAIPEFNIQWEDKQSEALLRILLKEMPGAEVFSRGQKLDPSESVPLTAFDVLTIRWREYEFFLRLVPVKKAPPSERDLIGDPLLKKVAAWVFGIGIPLVVLSVIFGPAEKPPEKVATRLATVEVKEYVPPPPAPPVAEEPVAQAEAPTQKQGAGFDTGKTSKGGQAAANRFNTPAGQERIGLNSPGDSGNVNMIGILGALGKAGAKGAGVKADRILNDGIITQAATGNSENANVVVRNPPAGVLGKGMGGGAKTEGPGLAAAQTTLQGAGKYDPSATGPVASKGGAAGYSLGTGSEDGEGLMSGKEIGALDGSAFKIEGGGLDKETVKRIIQGAKNQIRTCYEKTLLTTTNLDGRVVYDWVIGGNGAVQTVKIVTSTIQKSALQPCVEQVIRGMVFPAAASGRSTRVIYPFQFQSRR